MLDIDLAGLHLEHAVALAVEHAHVVRVLQERAANRHRLLVVEHAAVREPGRDVVEGSMIVRVMVQMNHPGEFIELTFKQRMENPG